ncbi:MAG TPA: hypothetical protein VKA08_13115 [Balneolales bacterium]|nr:hypothetical protein [Balneolales bacterium]
MKTIGVYRTNVESRTKAKLILEAIYRLLPGCEPSFDLEDCDKVLRVESQYHGINESKIRAVLKNYGYHMESMI